MKRLFLAILLPLMMANGFSQNQKRGIYLSERDFEQNKLSYSSPGSEGKYRITFNEFFRKPYITVSQDGIRKYLFKDEIFAYRRGKDVVRVWEQTPYIIMEKGVIWIYYRDLNFTKGKGYNIERKYFYSISGTSSILPLPTNYLRSGFPESHLYQQILNNHQQDDKDLTESNPTGIQQEVN